MPCLRCSEFGLGNRKGEGAKPIKVTHFPRPNPNGQLPRSILQEQRVKRLVVYGDMRTAVVEVPHPWSASVLGHPSTYPFYEDNDHVRISRLQPNPAAPEDVT